MSDSLLNTKILLMDTRDGVMASMLVNWFAIFLKTDRTYIKSGQNVSSIFEATILKTTTNIGEDEVFL